MERMTCVLQNTKAKYTITYFYSNYFNFKHLRRQNLAVMANEWKCHTFVARQRIVKHAIRERCKTYRLVETSFVIF